jgi:anti-sigma B factor antagonist
VATGLPVVCRQVSALYNTALDTVSFPLVAWRAGASSNCGERRSVDKRLNPMAGGPRTGNSNGGQQRGEIVRIEVRFKEDAAIVSLNGRFLAGSDGPYLRQKVKDLMDAGTKKLIVDFEDVPYIDSTGLGFLAGARVTVQNSGAHMVLTNLNAHVRRILNDVNLTQFFAIAAGEAAALTLLNQPGGGAEGSPGLAKGEPRAKKRTVSGPGV